MVIALSAPDTGASEWQAPSSPWPQCRLRVRSVADPALVDESDGAFAIRYRKPVRGTVWIPWADFDQAEVRGAIAAVTIWEHDFDWRLSRARTPEELRVELLRSEAFLMVQQVPRDDVNFAARGRAFADVLEGFVAQGGTAVVLKQRLTANDFLPATGLLDVVEIGQAFDVECRVGMPDHPVVNQVPEPFRSAAATGWYEVASGEAHDVDVYATTNDGHPVAMGRDLGDGRVVLIGFDYQDYTPESARLLANAVRMTRPTGPRPRFVRGDANASGRIDIVDATFILEYLFRGGAEPPCLDAADADDSAAVGPRTHESVNVSDAVAILRWLFVTQRPLPPPTARVALEVGDSCGTDPQIRDGLGCAAFPLCE